MRKAGRGNRGNGIADRRIPAERRGAHRAHGIFSSVPARTSVALLLCLSLTLSGCFLTSEVEPYYGRITVPQAQEFRWSDGGLPQTFDPALAAAPPDTDAVRALFEGLTDYDPQTLTPVPGVAARWESSEDKRVWTFHLRRDARWSNGDPVTAADFVRSWQRTLSLGSRAPHARLLDNIVGARPPEMSALTVGGEMQPPAPAPKSNANGVAREAGKASGTDSGGQGFGVEAVDEFLLRVRLLRPDDNFPSLVAHPIFRPVHTVRAEEGEAMLAQPIVTNGPFKLTQVTGDGVTLERASSYWDSQTVSLNRVRFVATNNAEEALERYRAGEVDAVTNAGFEPLALKLLAPYKDFRRATFGALTYYKFNTDHAPFNDVRVREALAIAIDRARISDDQMDGASEPAGTFLPTQGAGSAAKTEPPRNLSLDITRAQNLLREAGYPEGQGFPRIRLLVNRNDQQRQVAQSIASMWHRSLGIETEVMVKNWDEYEAALEAGDYDVARKGLVMQTMDEAATMRAMFAEGEPQAVEDAALLPGAPLAAGTPNGAGEKGSKESTALGSATGALSLPPIFSESDALRELPAMPVYFASSYALVKPYVTGFDANLLDAPSLKRVRLDTNWQAPKKNSAVWFKVGE